MGSTEKGRFESRITDPWCGSRATGWDGGTVLARFGGVFGSAGLDVECDGAPIGNGNDSQKSGHQCDGCNSCFSLGGFAEADDSKSIEGVRRWSDFDSADGCDGVDGGGRVFFLTPWVSFKLPRVFL